MSGKKSKVMVAFSGGVDSSTATALLLQRGYDCAGVFMITHDEAQKSASGAQTVAEELGIRLFVLDMRADFQRILDYFCAEYKSGRTPNPCVMCNRTMKFGRLMDFARENGFDSFATGHYARVLPVGAEYGLYAATNIAKDQSYALGMVRPEALERVILPMGEFTKEQTRHMAADFGLSTAEKEESQEICFIPDDDYVRVLEQMCPQLLHKGNVVDADGNILGEHGGVHRFTIGQRRGLGIAMGTPYYVVRLDRQTNTVTLGPRERTMHDGLIATDVNWLADRPQSPFEAMVKIRYNSPALPATVAAADGRIEVRFSQQVSAITPGQLAAVYCEDPNGYRLICAGWIARAF